MTEFTASNGVRITTTLVIQSVKPGSLVSTMTSLSEAETSALREYFAHDRAEQGGAG